MSTWAGASEEMHSNIACTYVAPFNSQAYPV